MNNLIGQLHLASALLALLLGGWVLARRKGTVSHRRAGWGYAVAMLLTNVTALAIYRLTGYFGPFHVAALISLGTLVAGIVPAWRRQPHNWVEYHYYFMAYSYLGLVAAAVAETATRLPAQVIEGSRPTPLFWILAFVASMAVFVIGQRFVKRGLATTLAPFQRSKT